MQDCPKKVFLRAFFGVCDSEKPWCNVEVEHPSLLVILINSLSQNLVFTHSHAFAGQYHPSLPWQMPSPHWNWKGNPKEVTNSLLTMGPESKNCFVSIGLRWITYVKFRGGSLAPVSKVAVGHASFYHVMVSWPLTTGVDPEKAPGTAVAKLRRWVTQPQRCVSQAKRRPDQIGGWKCQKNHPENIMKDKWWNSLESVGMMFFWGAGLVLFKNSMGNRTFCLTAFWCLVSRGMTDLPGFRCLTAGFYR